MLKIGEFANLFNVSIKTVRFYEEKELFKPFYIDKYTGYRYYDENNINEMTKILYLKRLRKYFYNKNINKKIHLP